MSDIVITAANIVPSSDAVIVPVTFGETVTAGQPIRKNTSTGRYVKAQATSLDGSRAEGIAAVGGGNGQRGNMIVKDPALAGITEDEGVLLAVSAANAGGIAPHGDLTTGDFPHIFGIMLESNVAKVDFEHPISTGSALPAA